MHLKEEFGVREAEEFSFFFVNYLVEYVFVIMYACVLLNTNSYLKRQTGEIEY